VTAITLAAIDVDGTLLTSGGTLPPKGRMLVMRAARRGVRIVLATMRVPERTVSFCHALGINDPIICTNGGQVWASPSGPVWAYRGIPQDVAATIAHYADTHGWELAITLPATTYIRQRPGQVPGETIGPYLTVSATNAAAVTGDPARILVYQPDAIAGVRAFCETTFPDHCRLDTHENADGSLHSVTISAPDASKGTGLALVCARLGVKRDQVLAIGDNLSDLSLFDQARVKVAVGNAIDTVKQAADAVAPTNDAEGVAWAIEKYILDLEQ
jgi:Cof subfamily protein (haloacid dehalogenase superfamily)